MDLIIEAQGLTKHFGEVEALAGLDLAAPSGQVLAVLGPTAPARPRSSARSPRSPRPTSGTLRVAGIDVVRQTPSRCAGSSASPGSTPRSSRP